MKAARNLLIELAIYGALVSVYALGILQFLADPLANLYHNDLTLYAWAGLFLIVCQGLALEQITSFLMSRLRLTRFD
jgi:hypothetical protein